MKSLYNLKRFTIGLFALILLAGGFVSNSYAVEGIRLNEALKQRVFDQADFTTMGSGTGFIDELTTLPETVHLGHVDLGNNFPKFLSIAQENGGVLFVDSTGKLITSSLLYNDEALSIGDARTRTALAFDAEAGLFAIPLLTSPDVELSLIHDQLGPQTTTTIEGTTVYEVTYETDSLDLDGNVEFVTWWFESTNNIFRLTVTDLDSGNVTYLSHSDAQLLAGEGISVPLAGEQTWEAIIPAIFQSTVSGYEIRAQSLSSDFRLRGDSTTAPWSAYAIFQGYISEVQEIFYLNFWKEKTYSVGDWIIQNVAINADPDLGPIEYNNKIFVCNTAGPQITDFDTNAALWDQLGSNNPNVANESISTALIYGCELSINTPTTLDIAAGKIRRVTLDAENNATVEEFLVGPFTNVAIPDIATAATSEVTIDVTNNPSVFSGGLTDGIIRTNVVLGVAVHPAGTLIILDEATLTETNTYNQFISSLLHLGTFRSGGLAVVPNADLTISKLSGFITFPGGGNAFDSDDENTTEVNAQNPASFRRFLGATGTLIEESASTTLIDPLYWDNGTGAKVLIGAPTAQSTNVFVFQAPREDGGLNIAYGQNVWPTLQDAIVNAPIEVHVIPDEIGDITNLIAVISVRSDATNLSLAAEAVFESGPKFGVERGGSLGSGGAGGGDVTGPASSVINEIATYTDTSGKTIKAESEITVVGGLLSAVAGSDLFIEDSRFLPGDALTYPIADGLAGDAIQTDGAGTLTLGTNSYDIITTSSTLDYDNKRAYLDSSGGDLTITLAANPRTGERKELWIGDNTNEIVLASESPSSPLVQPVNIAEANLQGAWSFAGDFVDRFTTGRDLTLLGTGGSFVPLTVNGRSVTAIDLEGTAYLEAVSPAYTGILGGSARSFIVHYAANAGIPTIDENLTAWDQDIAPGGLYYEAEFRGTQGYFWVSNRNASRRWNLTTLDALGLFDGNAHNIAITQSTANMGSVSLYIDKVQIPHDFQDTFPNSTTTAGPNFRVGSNYQASAQLNARLYDARLYNKALSLAEVTTIADQDLTGGTVISGLPNNTIIDVVYNDIAWAIGDAVPISLLEVGSRVATLEANRNNITDDTGSATITPDGRLFVAGPTARVDVNSELGNDTVVAFSEDAIIKGFIGYDESEDNMVVIRGSTIGDLDGISIGNLGMTLGTRVAINTPTEGGKALIVKGIDLNQPTQVEFVNNGTGDTKLYIRTDDAGSPLIQFQQTGNLRAHVGYDNASQTLCLGNGVFPSANMTLDQGDRWALNGVPDNTKDIAFDMKGISGSLGLPPGTSAEIALLTSRGGTVAYDSDTGEPVYYDETQVSYIPIGPADVMTTIIEGTLPDSFTQLTVKYGAPLTYTGPKREILSIKGALGVPDTGVQGIFGLFVNGGSVSNPVNLSATPGLVTESPMSGPAKYLEDGDTYEFVYDYDTGTIGNAQNLMTYIELK